MLPGTLSLILFSLELIMLIVIIIKNRGHPFFSTIVIIMGLLQLYQLSEFLICIGVDANVVGRIGFVIITFLPPMGYFLSTQITNWKYKDYLLGFGLAIFFAVYYTVVPKSVILVNCNPLYATYDYPLYEAYGFYYYGMIVYSIGFLTYHIVAKKNIFKKSSILLLIGYLAFLAPMQIMVLVDRKYGASVPSIMCKYAFLLAIVLLIFSFNKPEIPVEKIKAHNVEVLSTTAK
ncbi:MAG: hypothetical protein ACTSYD_03130 [Candidatus Heimdallarchaeaceae archaeon]